MRRLALAATFSAVLAIAAMYALVLLPGEPPGLVPWVFAIAVATLIMALQLLGATSGGRRLGRLAWVFGFCFLIVAGGLVGALIKSETHADDRLWLGLPAGAAIVFYIVGLLPMLILPLAYALTFDDARS